MSQLLHIDFYLNDQAGVETLIDFMTSSHADMAVEGYKEIAHYVDQDNPLHLVYIVQWTSRDHYDKAMAKMFANQEIAAMLNAVLTEPATSTFLDKME